MSREKSSGTTGTTTEKHVRLRQIAVILFLFVVLVSTIVGMIAVIVTSVLEESPETERLTIQGANTPQPTDVVMDQPDWYPKRPADYEIVVQDGGMFYVQIGGRWYEYMLARGIPMVKRASIRGYALFDWKSGIPKAYFYRLSDGAPLWSMTLISNGYLISSTTPVQNEPPYEFHPALHELEIFHGDIGIPFVFQNGDETPYTILILTESDMIDIRISDEDANRGYAQVDLSSGMLRNSFYIIRKNQKKSVILEEVMFSLQVLTPLNTFTAACYQPCSFHVEPYLKKNESNNGQILYQIDK
ncbi:MAG: hypothetical protein ACOCXQ_03995 [Patescibacteria group bacterium]